MCAIDASDPDVTMEPTDQSGPTAAAVPRAFGEWLRPVLDGGLATLLVLLAVAGTIMAGLFATVHRQSEESLRRNVPPRYRELITFWKERGYVRHGGLWIRSPVDPEGWSPP